MLDPTSPTCQVQLTSGANSDTFHLTLPSGLEVSYSSPEELGRAIVAALRGAAKPKATSYIPVPQLIALSHYVPANPSGSWTGRVHRLDSRGQRQFDLTDLDLD
jgi:hypothetical protein